MVAELVKVHNKIILGPTAARSYAVPEEDTLFGFGLKGVALRTTNIQETDERTEGNEFILEMVAVPTEVRTVTFGCRVGRVDVIGETEILCSRRPPMRGQPGLSEHGSGSIFDFSNNAFCKPIGLRTVRR